MQKSNERVQSETENAESAAKKGTGDQKAPLAGFADMLATAEAATQTQAQPEIQAEAPMPKAPEAHRRTEARRAADGAVSSVAEFETQRRLFWNENGVELTKKDGRYEFRMHGYKETLCTSDATPQGLEEAHKKIEQLRQQKMAELTKTYGAKFSKDGETAGKQIVYDQKSGNWIHGTDDVKCRSPKMHELLGIEAALKVSQPSARGVKFYVMTTQIYKNLTEMGEYHPVPTGGSDKSAKPGDPAIFLNGSITMNYPSTEAAAKNWFNKDRHGDSIENTITHELGHHSQNRMDWGISNKKAAVTFGMEMAGQMGWVTKHPPDRETNLWFLTDKNGNTWKHEHVAGNEWVRMKPNGAPLDKNGNVCPYANVDRVTNDQMVEMAKVRPFSAYNDTPREMFAEGMTAFRDGQRALLWQNNRALYNVMKAADQREINKAHPPGKDKKPTHIRAVDGTIVANTAAAQAEIQQLEK